MTDNRPLNAKGKPFSWSFSAVNDFDTCPYQYAAKRYHCTVQFEDTPATIWGTRVHDAMEKRLQFGTALPEGMTQWEKYPRLLEQRAKDLCGTLKPEEKITFNLLGEQVSWFGKDAWARGAIDVLIRAGDTAYIYDWKTGKQKDNLLQLQIFMWFVATKYPDINNFVTRFIWLNTGNVTGEDFTRDKHLKGIEDDLHVRLSRMNTAWREKVFQPKESGLCRGWCPVEECRHWKEKRR
jgi:hypothetical protein